MAVGKHINGVLYIHRDFVDLLPSAEDSLYRKALEIIGAGPFENSNVVKVDRAQSKVSMLKYRQFFDNPFPSLAGSLAIDCDLEKIQHRSYESSANPPILHRKELLLDPSHSRYPEFSRLTRELENLGLYQEPNKIGHRRNWASRLAQADIGIIGHRIVRLGDAPNLSPEKPW
jgi:DNA phosphorothioation-associated putative methyltransferase